MREWRGDLADFLVAFGCIAFLIALYALLPWWLQAAWAVVLTFFVYVRLTRGKMDSHRRDDRSGSGDPVVFRGGGERGSNINHVGHVPHAAE